MSIKASVGLDLNDAINYMGQSVKVNLDNLTLQQRIYKTTSTWVPVSKK